MGKKLHLDLASEREANDIGKKFMNSTDVVGDMSRAYGVDLSSVKIHTDSAAAGMAAQRGVDAFSTGRDVFFGQGIFDRNDPASRGLLAHELSHSLQQGVGGEMGGMQQSAPMGAEQGGLIDWFRSLKKRMTRSKRGYDSTKGSRGFMLPEEIRNMGTGQNKETRFQNEEARDFYVDIFHDRSKLNDPEVMDKGLALYRNEMSKVSSMYGKKDGENFMQEVMRGQKAGGMKLISMLMQHHVNDGLLDEVAAGYQDVSAEERMKEMALLSDMPDGEEKYNKIMEIKRRGDPAANIRKLTGLVGENEGLQEILMEHADVLSSTGFFESQDKADEQAMSDFVLRALNPELMMSEGNENLNEHTRKNGKGLSKQIQTVFRRETGGRADPRAMGLLGLLKKKRTGKK